MNVMNFDTCEQRFASSFQSMQMLSGSTWTGPAGGSQVRSFAHYPSIVMQNQNQAMPIRSSSPINLRPPSPISFSQIGGSPVMQFVPPPQERYPSPIPGTLSAGSIHSVYIVSNRGTIHFQSPPLQSMVLQHSPLPFQPQNLPSRGSPSFPMDVVGSSVPLAHTPAFAQPASFSYQHGDPSIVFMARMQQRQNAKQQMEMDWQKWDSNPQVPAEDRDGMQGARHPPTIRDMRGISPGRARMYENGSNQSQRPANLPIRSLLSMTITVVAARNLPAIKGTCNPYCTVRQGKQVQKTSVCFESINPRWNQPCTVIAHEPDSDVGISVQHWDPSGNEELIGVVSFTTAQVLAGLSERAFVIKYLDGTAIIGNDGCPAYLDVAVDISGRDPSRDGIHHEFRRAPSPQIQRVPSFDNQRMHSADQFKGKHGVHHRPFTKDRESPGELHDDQKDWRKDRGSRERAFAFGNTEHKSNPELPNSIVEKSGFDRSLLSNSRNIYPDQPLGSLQEFQRKSVHEMQRKETANTPRNSVSDSLFSSIQEGTRLTSHDPYLSFDTQYSSLTTSSRTASTEVNRGPINSLDKQTSEEAQRTLMHDLERSLLHDVQKNTMINPQRSSLGSTNITALPPRLARSVEENVQNLKFSGNLEINREMRMKNSAAAPLTVHPSGGEYERRDRCATSFQTQYGAKNENAELKSSKSKYDIPSLYASTTGHPGDTKDRPLYASSAGNLIDKMSSQATSDRLHHHQTMDQSNFLSTISSVSYVMSPHGASGNHETAVSSTILGRSGDLYTVGIKITDGPPYLVSQVQSLMDENCVLQGIQGFKYEPIAAGDRLIMLDGVPVEHLSSKDVDKSMKGPMLSICEIVFESCKSRHQCKILAMRHILLREDGEY